MRGNTTLKGSLWQRAAAAVAIIVAASAFATRPEDLPPEQFLLLARRPLVEDGWLQASGVIQFRQADAPVATHALRIAARFGERRLAALLTVDGSTVYRMTVSFPDSQAAMPRETMSHSGEDVLEQLGMRPSDFSLTFLYWPLVKELPDDVVSGQPCRVFILRNPSDDRWAHVWLHAHFAFPLRVVWYTSPTGPPARTLEFRDFKRQGRLWFLRECRLRGPGWKTRVILHNIDLALTEDRPPPPGLLDSPRIRTPNPRAQAPGNAPQRKDIDRAP